MMQLQIRKLFSDARIPERNNATDSGLDVFAYQDTAVYPGETVIVKTGIAVQVADVDEDGYNTTWTYGVFAWDKSGLASKGLKTGAGVIDNPYTGEIGIVVTNVGGIWHVLTNLFHMLLSGRLTMGVIGQSLKASTVPYVFLKENKVAQLVVQRVELPQMIEVDSFQPTARGANGYGSSGE